MFIDDILSEAKEVAKNSNICTIFIDAIVKDISEGSLLSGELTLSKDNVGDVVNAINDSFMASPKPAFRLVTDPIIHKYILHEKCYNLHDIQVFTDERIRNKIVLMFSYNGIDWKPFKVFDIKIA